MIRGTLDIRPKERHFICTYVLLSEVPRVALNYGNDIVVDPIYSLIPPPLLRRYSPYLKGRAKLDYSVKTTQQM